MSEKDLLQAILRNCIPRLASIIRGTVKTVNELVRVGTLVERDLPAVRGYWSQAHTDTMESKLSASKAQPRILLTPVLSSLHLLQKSLWRERAEGKEGGVEAMWNSELPAG
ncbi:hypothetical protein MHYP_G00289960 [Metynnis hypsauchen]